MNELDRISRYCAFGVDCGGACLSSNMCGQRVFTCVTIIIVLLNIRFQFRTRIISYFGGYLAYFYVSTANTTKSMSRERRAICLPPIHFLSDTHSIPCTSTPPSSRL